MRGKLAAIVRPGEFASLSSRHRWLCFFLAAMPALMPLYLILRFGVDFHYFDEWMPDMAGILVKAHQHQLILGDILAQHNEHRPAVMRLIWLAVNPITHWNNVDNLVVGWLVVATTSLLIWRLIRQTWPAGGGFFLWFLCNLLIFSPAQHENWLWGMGLANFTPTPFVLATFLAARSRLPIWIRFFLCIPLAALATFSIGNGILAWPLGGLLLIWPESRDPGTRKKWPGIFWLIACAAAILLYRHGYLEPEHHGNPYVRTFGAVSKYTLAYLGCPFPRLLDLPGQIDRMVLGGLMFACAVAPVIYFFVVFRAGRRELCGRILPWLMVAGYGILSGMTAAFYRAEFGPDQAVSSRYVSFAIYLPMALVNLAPIIVDELRRRSPAPRPWMRAPAIAAIALIVLQIPGYPRSIDDARTRQDRFRLGKGALLLLNILPDDPQAVYLGPLRPARLEETANALSEIGYLQPPMIASNDAAEIQRQDSGDPRHIAGAMDGLIANAAGLMYAQGWAVYPLTGRVADSVFITYLDAQGDPIIIAAARMRLARDDLAGKLPADELHDCGWQAMLDPRRIPAWIHPIRIEAWALDVDSGFVTPLGGPIAIER